MSITDIQILTTIILFSFLLSGIISIPIINILYKFKVVRKIDVDFSTLIEDRKRKYGTPIMGGLIFIIPVIIINYIFNFNTLTQIPLFIFTATAALGALDDLLNIFGKPRKVRTAARAWTLIKVHKNPLVKLKLIILFPWYVFTSIMHLFESSPGSGLRAHEKLLIQGGLGLLLGLWVHNFIGANTWIPFLGSIDLGLWIIPFAAITFMAMTNAVNITDGMDGLSAGLCFSSLNGFILVSFLSSNIVVSTLIVSMIGALIVYLYFNIPPARVQMGDTGSFALGAFFTIVAFGLQKPLLLIIICLPFVIEILSTIVQSTARRILGRRVLQMAPLHHHFEMLGWSEEKVVIRFWIISLICVLFGFWLSFF